MSLIDGLGCEEEGVHLLSHLQHQMVDEIRDFKSSAAWLTNGSQCIQGSPARDVRRYSLTLGNLQSVRWGENSVPPKWRSSRVRPEISKDARPNHAVGGVVTLLTWTRGLTRCWSTKVSEDRLEMIAQAFIRAIGES